MEYRLIQWVIIAISVNMAPGSQERGSSSTFNAAVNLAKVSSTSNIASTTVKLPHLQYCVGAGILALPHATRRGGLLFSPIMTAIVASWNWLASLLLMECKEVTRCVEWPHHLSSNYSRVAYAGAGQLGVALADFSIIVTLLGVCIAFQITFATLLSEVPGNRYSVETLTVMSGIVVYPMSCFRDLSSISWLSLLGMACLVASVAAILLHGSRAFGAATVRDYFSSAEEQDYADRVTLWPSTWDAAAAFVGVIIFCFDICSLAFPIEESMRHREEFSKAVVWALVGVWAVYALLGDVGAMLYMHDPRGIKENILGNLPVDSALTLMVRWAMACVGLLTYPITLVPAAQMLEHRIGSFCSSSARRWAYTAITEGSPSSPRDRDVPHTPSSALTRCANRLLLVGATTAVAVALPCFGTVISLLGGFTIAIVDFILPPLLHLRILVFRVHERLPCSAEADSVEGGIALRNMGNCKPAVTGGGPLRTPVSPFGKGNEDCGQSRVERWGGRTALLWKDCALLALGTTICAGTTSMAVMAIYRKVIEKGTC